MSIRPVDFNGMIQNTQEVSNTKAQEDNKLLVHQHNIQTMVVKEEQQMSSTVQDMEQAQHHEYDYSDGEGDGKGYQGNQGRKKKNVGKNANEGDGSVVIKNSRPSFDIKI